MKQAKQAKHIKYSKKELSKIVEAQGRRILELKNTVAVLDTGLFLALYSLMQEDKLHMPDNLKTKQDIKDTGVSQTIEKIYTIIKKAIGTEAVDVEEENK